MSTSESERNKLPSRISDFKVEDLLHVGNIQGSRFRSVFKVNLKHVNTVGELKKVISTRHGLSVVALLYQGVCLADEHKLAHLLPDLQNIGAPRFLVRTRLHSQPKPGGMSLQVKGLNGSTFLVHMAAQSTVADLVTAIMDYEAYSSDQDIQITCAGKCLSALDSSSTLAKCKVVSESVVHVAGKLRGGNYGGNYIGLVRNFVDMADVSILATYSVKQLESGDPSWEVLCRGLNIEGKCRNYPCQACDQRVVCQKGFAVFNIAEAVHCPACGSRFAATTVAFYECEWMFEGRKAGIPPIDMVSKWHLSMDEEEYQWFYDDEKGRNMVHWIHLVITAKELTSKDIKDGLNNLRLDPKDCAICFGTLTTESPKSCNMKLTCGHTVHSDCKTALQDCGYKICPTCRDPIAE